VWPARYKLIPNYRMTMLPYTGRLLGGMSLQEQQLKKTEDARGDANAASE